MITLKRHPMISVIIPAYNEEENIKRVLNSVIRQAYANFEIIVVSNGSTDSTLDLAKGFTPLVYDLAKKGVAMARNFGAEKANGDIFVFLDADTAMGEDLLGKVCLAAEEGYIGGKAKILPEKKNMYSRLFWFLDNLVDKLIFYQMGISNICSYTPLVFCKRQHFERVGGFPEDLVATEEIQLLKKLQRTGKIKFMEDVCVTTSGRRAEKQGLFYGGFFLPFFHFFFPRSKKFPYTDVR